MALTDKQARDWAMLVHLSALAGLVVPFGNLLGPLVMWMVKKDESAFVDRHGKAAVNFQLSLLIYAICAVAIIGLVAAATFGIGVLLLLPLIIVAVLALMVLVILLPILACVKAQNGEEYTYPLAIQFLK